MATLTAQIRKILRETNAAKYDLLYTNKYENCRTVKCYIDTAELTDVAQARIEDLCVQLNIPVTFKRRYNSSAWGAMSSFIVRVPLEN